jgi:hypothetical protein
MKFVAFRTLKIFINSASKCMLGLDNAGIAGLRFDLAFLRICAYEFQHYRLAVPDAFDNAYQVVSVIDRLAIGSNNYVPAALL